MAVNVAVVLADVTVTEAGTVNAAALDVSVTVVPPVFDTVTVQVDDPPELMDAGAQLSAVGVGGEAGATNEIDVARELPPEVAVTTAL